MNWFDADYYRYKIFKGIPFDVQVYPVRDYGKIPKENSNIHSDDADVCLNCTRNTCTGSRRCYEKRRSEILLEQRRTKKAKADRKEVMD